MLVSRNSNPDPHPSVFSPASPSTASTMATPVTKCRTVSAITPPGDCLLLPSFHLAFQLQLALPRHRRVPFRDCPLLTCIRHHSSLLPLFTMNYSPTPCTTKAVLVPDSVCTTLLLATSRGHCHSHASKVSLHLSAFHVNDARQRPEI